MEGKKMGYLSEWLDSHPEEGTQKVYYAGVKKLLASVYEIELGAPKEKFNELSTTLVNEVKAGERDAFKTLLGFVVSMNGAPPTSVKAYYSAAKNFLEYALNVEFTKKQIQQLKGALPRGKLARTVEGELTPEILKGVLAHCDIKGKALFLLLESSGIRISEALALTFADIDLDSKPPKVTVRGEQAKEGDMYYSFISTEAVEALKEWLKVRDSYYETATKRGVGLIQTGYGRGEKEVGNEKIFPFSDSVAQMMWNNAIEKLGLRSADRQTGRQAFRIHMLRKYFMSQMKLKIPEVIVEALCGHGTYLSEAYRRYSKTQIAEFYLQGEPVLYVNVPAEFVEIKSMVQAQAEESAKKIADLYQKLTDSNLYVNKLRERLEDQEEKMADREKALEAIAENYENLSKQLDESIKEIREEIQNQREIEGAKKDLEDTPQE
jgi:integrase